MRPVNSSMVFLTGQKTQERRTLSVGGEVACGARCSYLNIRPKAYFATPPSSKVISSRPSTGRNLEPGKYLLPHDMESNSFEFNKSPRFTKNSKNFYQVVSVLFKKVSEKEKEEISKRIEKNKDLALMSLKAKSQLAKEKAFKNSVRASVTKLTKEKIYQQNKKKRETVLKEKFKQFEYRMNIEKVTQVVKSWLFINTLAGISTVVKHLIKNRKRLRIRSLRLLMWLRAMSRCSGKIKLTLQKIKTRQSLTKIRVLFLPKLKNWLKFRHKACKEILVNVLEQQLSTAILTKLIKNWELKMIYIKKSLKNFLFFKYSLYESLIIKWNRAEHSMFGDVSDLTGKRRRNTVGLKNLKNLNSGCSSIPNELKIFYLRQAVKQIILRDLTEFRVYKVSFRKVHVKNVNNRWAGYPHAMLDYPVKPRLPNVYESFDEEKVVELINFALKDRANWGKHVDSGRTVRQLQRYPTQF